MPTKRGDRPAHSGNSTLPPPACQSPMPASVLPICWAVELGVMPCVVALGCGADAFEDALRGCSVLPGRRVVGVGGGKEVELALALAASGEGGLSRELVLSEQLGACSNHQDGYALPNDSTQTRNWSPTCEHTTIVYISVYTAAAVD